MSYGGIEEVEIDEDYDYFYVHRDNGEWNRYKISQERDFLNWIIDHRERESDHGTIGDIPIYDLGYEEEQEERESKKEKTEEDELMDLYDSIF